MSFKVKFERRTEISRKLSAAVSTFFILAALLVASLIFELLGVNAAETLNRVITVFISPSTLLQAILRGLPMGFAALGLTLAFKMNFWNIGADGQIYMGMMASTGIVLLHVYYGYFPDFLVLPIMIAASFLAGGLYCALPAFLKAKLGV
ncbi:MAG: hypothetical protein RMK31_08700, partial [Candidatus Caldarchaeum sp.]|nr:hypothetical protein [Candidatus Caldarchaeum sp.]